jgi:hypothetical protein
MSATMPNYDPSSDAPDATDATASLPTEATPTESARTGQGDPAARAKIAEEKFQARYDTVRREGGRLLSSPYWKSLGGDGIQRALEQFEAMLEDPSTAKSVKEGLVQNAEGRWVYKPTSQAQATAAAVDGDAFDDPVLKQFESRLDERLGPLIEKINALAPQLNTLSTANATSQVEQMTRRFLAEYPMSPEERAEFSESIGPTIEGMNPQMVLKMNYDQFEDHVGLPKIKKFLPAILARKARTKVSQLADLATDGVGAGSQGADTAPAGKQPVMSMQQLKKSLAAAAEKASREPQ